MKVIRHRSCYECEDSYIGEEIMYEIYPNFWICERCVREFLKKKYNRIYEEKDGDIEEICKEVNIYYDTVENINENLYLSTLD